MRTPLRFDLVDTREKFEQMKVFAATMGHHIDNGTRLPIVRIFRGTKQIAYYQIVNGPLVAPAFHTDPAVCSPRDTKEIIEHVRSHFILNSIGKDRMPNGEVLAILPETPAEGFRDGIIEKCGFIDLHQKIWQSLG